jgi:hypothetical protein
MLVGIRKIAIRLPAIDVLPNHHTDKRHDDAQSTHKERLMVPAVTPGLFKKGSELGSNFNHGRLPHGDNTPHPIVSGGTFLTGCNQLFVIRNNLITDSSSVKGAHYQSPRVANVPPINHHMYAMRGKNRWRNSHLKTYVPRDHSGNNDGVSYRKGLPRDMKTDYFINKTTSPRTWHPDDPCLLSTNKHQRRAVQPSVSCAEQSFGVEQLPTSLTLPRIEAVLRSEGIHQHSITHQINKLRDRMI